MSTISGVSAVDTSAYTSTQTAAKAASSQAAPAEKAADNAGVVYEKSTKEGATKKYAPDPELIQRLKAENQARVDDFRSLVEKLIGGQGNAIGQADDIWKTLASGKFTVSEAAKAQAQADIAEGGYWSVEETSNRILDFAKALTGGDPAQIDKMRDAFEKGFKQATKAWGRELPSISNDTYDAVMKGFDNWAAEASAQ